MKVITWDMCCLPSSGIVLPPASFASPELRHFTFHFQQAMNLTRCLPLIIYLNLVIAQWDEVKVHGDDSILFLLHSFPHVLLPVCHGYRYYCYRSRYCCLQTLKYECLSGWLRRRGRERDLIGTQTRTHVNFGVFS